MSSQGRRKAPNGYYWVNIQVNGKGKLVMAIPVEQRFKVLSNSSKLNSSWKASDIKKRWSFKIVEEKELTFHDFFKKAAI